MLHFVTFISMLSMFVLQSKRKPNVLLEFVDDIEEYGKAASKMITKYNPVFQKPVITPNISAYFLNCYQWIKKYFFLTLQHHRALFS